MYTYVYILISKVAYALRGGGSLHMNISGYRVAMDTSIVSLESGSQGESNGGVPMATKDQPKRQNDFKSCNNYISYELPQLQSSYGDKDDTCDIW